MTLNRPQIQTIILVGGKGSRLGKLTASLPKPMIEINGRPFLNYLFAHLQRHRINQVCLMSGFLGNCIESYYKQNPIPNLTIQYSHEQHPLGTGGAIAQALHRYSAPYYLCLNGDTIFDIDLDEFLAQGHRTLEQNPQFIGVMALSSNFISERYESFDLANTSQLKLNGPYINGGIYLFRAALKELLPVENNSIEQFIVDHNSRFAGLVFNQKLLDIGTPSNLLLAVRDLKK